MPEISMVAVFRHAPADLVSLEDLFRRYISEIDSNMTSWNEDAGFVIGPPPVADFAVYNLPPTESSKDEASIFVPTRITDLMHINFFLGVFCL